MSSGKETIDIMTAVLLSEGTGDTYQAHSIGIETGLRLAFRYPEYARHLLAQVDEEMKALGNDLGRQWAEAVLDDVVNGRPATDILPDARSEAARQLGEDEEEEAHDPQYRIGG